MKPAGCGIPMMSTPLTKLQPESLKKAEMKLNKTECRNFVRGAEFQSNVVSFVRILECL